MEMGLGLFFYNYNYEKTESIYDTDTSCSFIIVILMQYRPAGFRWSFFWWFQLLSLRDSNVKPSEGVGKGGFWIENFICIDNILNALDKRERELFYDMYVLVHGGFI